MKIIEAAKLFGVKVIISNCSYLKNNRILNPMM